MNLHEAINNILDGHIGEENAISWADLCWQVNQQISPDDVNSNELRGIIHDLRQGDSLICSSQRGYYRPKDYGEVKDFTDRLRQPSRDQLLTARIQRDAARRHFAGQLDMFPKGNG